MGKLYSCMIINEIAEVKIFSNSTREFLTGDTGEDLKFKTMRDAKRFLKLNSLIETIEDEYV